MLTTEMPDEVRLSMKLVFVTFAVQLIAEALALMTIDSGWAQLSAAAREQRMTAAATSALNAAVMLICLPFLGWMYYSVKNRRKWPRVVLVVNCVFALIGTLNSWDRFLTDWTVNLAANGTLLLILATILLFRSDASRWFDGIEGGSELGEACAVDALVRSLDESQVESVRIAAVTTLGQIKETRAVSALLAVFSANYSWSGARNWRLHAAVATALGDIGDPSAIPPLTSLLEEARQWLKYLHNSRGWWGDDPSIRQMQEDDESAVSATLTEIHAALRKLERLTLSAVPAQGDTNIGIAESASAPQFRPSVSLHDRRGELGPRVHAMKGWGGLTVDFIGANLVNQDAACKAFEVISSRARQHVSGRGLVVVFANIQGKYTAGIICPVWETEVNMQWFGDTTIEGMEGRPVKLADQNGEQFGWPDSPLTVYDFVVVQVNKA